MDYFHLFSVITVPSGIFLDLGEKFEPCYALPSVGPRVALWCEPKTSTSVRDHQTGQVVPFPRGKLRPLGWA